MNKPLILALDVGTSSVRASLYDAEANPIPAASVKIERSLAVTSDGGAEIDPDEAVTQVVEAIDTLLQKTSVRKGDVNYVASSFFWHSLMGIDASGKPTTNVFGWADTRSRNYTESFRKRFNETEVHNRTGARFHSSFWPVKLLWLRKESPDVWAQTDKWLSFSDYLGLKLIGDSTTGISMASGTGMFDLRKCIWDDDLLKFLEIKPSNLPELTTRDSQIFALNREFAKRWPRLAAAKWFAAIGDGAADNIGAGCVTKSQAVLMVGTSGAMRAAYPGDPPAKIPDGLWCYRIDRKRVIIGGALSDGGNLYAWLKKNLSLPKNAEEIISKRNPGQHGLRFLPFLAGERSTGYRESATGSIIGLKSATDAIDILQSAFESVAYRFAEILAELDLLAPIKKIVASGGALRESPVWAQIIADVLGKDLIINEVEESSSRGAVLLAMESIGKIESIENFPEQGVKILAYHPKCHGVYKRARKKHYAFYKTILEKNS